MTIFYIICGALIVAMAMFQFNHINKRKKLSDELVNLVATQQFKQLYQKAEEQEVTRYIPEFNRYLLCMNAALIENNNNKVTQYFDKLSVMTLNEPQKKAVFMKGLQYFITTHDVQRCQTCYNALISLDMDESTKQYLEEINSVMILKQNDKLDEILHRIDTNPNPDVFADEFLVAEIYKNLGDKDKSSTYSNLAKQHLDQFIKEKKQ